MINPREYWIVETEIGITAQTVSPRLDKDGYIKDEANEYIHVREIIPIDWQKVWADYENEMNWLGEYPKEKIQQLVEKQLRGEE